MNDELLRYYNEELEYLRQSGSEFANRHPKIAGSLKVNKNGFEDPMVERLTASFSFLTAKLQRQINADHKELAYEMLSLLYPQLLLPIPSMIIAEIKPQSTLSAPTCLNKSSLFTTDDSESDAVTFSTTMMTNILPLTITNTQYADILNLKGIVPPTKDGRSVLRIFLSKTEKEFMFDNDDIAPLRLYMNVQKQYAGNVYELMAQHVQSIHVLDAKKQLLGTVDASFITPLGFNDDDALLPYPRQAHTGFRLITEFCNLTEKFMFFDVAGLNTILSKTSDTGVYLAFVFDDYRQELLRAFHPDSVLLGCVPMVNMYEKTSDPLRVDHKKTRYHLPVMRYEAEPSDEIYQVNSLAGWYENGDDLPFSPVFGLNYNSDKNKDAILWQSIRQPSWECGAGSHVGDDIMLQFSYPSHYNAYFESWAVTANLLCFNRVIGRHINELKSTVADIDVHIVKPATPVVRPSLSGDDLWRQLRAMTLLQQGITQGPNALEAIRQLVALFNRSNNDAVTLLVAQFVSMTSCTTTRRFIQDGGLCFVQGMKVTICCQSGQIESYEYYLLGCVLHYFFNQFCAMNSFVELVLKDEHDQWEEVWKPLSLRGICVTL
jgi:type VI secretion system protein ImpG